MKKLTVSLIIEDLDKDGTTTGGKVKAETSNNFKIELPAGKLGVAVEKLLVHQIAEALVAKAGADLAKATGDLPALYLRLAEAAADAKAREHQTKAAKRKVGKKAEASEPASEPESEPAFA